LLRPLSVCVFAPSYTNVCGGANSLLSLLTALRATVVQVTADDKDKDGVDMVGLDKAHRKCARARCAPTRSCPGSRSAAHGRPRRILREMKQSIHDQNSEARRAGNAVCRRPASGARPGPVRALT
jgi:hypothetical protein